MKEDYTIKVREYKEKDYFTLIVDFQCSCKKDKFVNYYIDGEEPYSANYKVDTLELLECESCNDLFLRRVSCDYFDMSGDNDKYTTTYSKTTIPSLVKQLLELEKSI